MPEGTTVGWAIIGASQIARSWVADAICARPDSALRCVVSRDADRGRAFTDEFGIPTAATSLDEALATPGTHAVSGPFSSAMAAWA